MRHLGAELERHLGAELEMCQGRSLGCVGAELERVGGGA